MKTILMLILSVLCLTGCVSVEITKDNTCYRYVDYKNEEHFMNYQGNDCYTSYGNMYCANNKKRVKVYEYEKVECPKKEDNV